jgi:thiamine-phosphate pyrophosphorylase
MKLALPRLYAIIDAALLKTSELSTAESLADSGVQLIQYRNKQIPPRRLLGVSRSLIEICRSRGARYVVNDRADVAAVAGAEGLHVGQADLAVEDARALCGAACWIGVSTHTLEQVREADRTSADYIAVGPIFATSTKERPDPVVGIEFVRKARVLTRKPLVAIGGLTLERAADVYRAGADSLAVARDLICAPDPSVRAREYLHLAATLATDLER